MNPLFLLKDCFSRAFARKWAPIALIILFLLSTMCGIVFVKTPSFYDYHLRLCERYLNNVCYSDRSVFLIFFERTAACGFLLALVLCGGLHPVCILLPLAAIAYRGYTFGGSLAVFFSVYEFSGAIVAVVLYLPIHLLTDTVILLAAALSFFRAFRFSFCTPDVRELLFDFLLLLCLLTLICFGEMLLLAILFHPIGNLL